MGYQVILERLEQLWRRIQGYPQHEVLIELAVLWILIYLMLRSLRGTRGARAIRGMAMILIAVTVIVKLLASDNAYERMNFLYGGFIFLAMLAMLFVFQPELRRLMVRLGEARFISPHTFKRSRTVDEIVAAVGGLAKHKIGALIAIERNVGLKGIVEGGTLLDAQVSKELLTSLFWPGSALHDMGVIIQGDRVLSAGVQFPLAEDDKYDTDLGSRHRAAIGLSQEADALVVVVSEETGIISLVTRGKMLRPLDPDQLRNHLLSKLRRTALTQEGESPENGVESETQSEARA